MTNLPTNRKSSLPIASLETVGLVDRFTSRIAAIPGTINRFAIPASCAPSEVDRQALQARHDALSQGFAACPPEAIGKYVATLKMSGLVARATDEAGAAMEMRLTVKALESFPEWIIRDVCHRFLDGRLGGGRFVPTGAEIAQECRTAMLPHQEELGRIGKVLSAEVYTEATDDERERIRVLVTDLAAELKARSGPDYVASKAGIHEPPEVIQARAMEQVKDRAAEFRADPPQLSEAMKRKLSEPTLESHRRGIGVAAPDRSTRLQAAE